MTRYLAIVLVLLFGFGQGLVFPTVMLWVEELVPTDRQDQFSSYIAMAGYISEFLSPVLFGVVAGPFRTQSMVVAAAILAGVSFLGSGVQYVAH